MAKIYRVTVPVTDLGRAVRFYSAMLCEDGERVAPDWHYFSCGPVTLACHLSADSRPNSEPLYLSATEALLNLQTRAAMQGASAVDGEIGMLPTGERGFSLSDPFGNRICFVDAATAGWRPEAPRPITATSFAAKADVLPMERDFINAVKGGELARVRQMLSLDADLAHARDAAGVSALMHAAYKRHTAVANHLLTVCRDLNIWEAAAFGLDERIRQLLMVDATLARACSVDGFTPLGLACFFGHPACVSLLIERGADVNAPSRNALQVQPLHSALSHPDVEIARIIVHQLLSCGANANARQQGGYTPLHQAADRGDLGLVQLLLQAAARADLGAVNGRSALDFARSKGHAEVFELLGSTLRPGAVRQLASG